MSKKLSSVFVLLAAFCIIWMTGCSLSNFSENETGDDTLVVSGISRSYGALVTTAGTVNAYCYYASDLETQKLYAKQNAIAAWESYTKTSWSTAGSTYFTWLVNPTFTGSGVYFVYVQASGCPYIPDYGSLVTAAGTVNAYCYYASDLETQKLYAKQNAITAWESYTKSSWATARADKYFTWLVNPSFTGSGVYFVYVQASGCPLLP